MAYQETPPFDRGFTRFGGSPVSATDGAGFEGKEYTFPDKDWGSSDETKPDRSTGMVRVRVVRNLSGGALLPKRIAKMKLDGTAYEERGQVSGYAETVGEHGFPIDEFLPAAGVAANDLFYVVVDGCAKVTSAAAGDTTVAIGEYVIPSTDGKVIGQDPTVAAGAATFNQVFGTIGRAVTAVAAINTDFVIEVIHR